MGWQLIRSGTSIGANVEEAQAAQSKPDFIAKMSIAHKEANETSYWIRLIIATSLLPKVQLTDILDESEQIKRILAAILIKAKANS